MTNSHAQDPGPRAAAGGRSGFRSSADHIAMGSAPVRDSRPPGSGARTGLRIAFWALAAGLGLSVLSSLSDPEGARLALLSRPRAPIAEPDNRWQLAQGSEPTPAVSPDAELVTVHQRRPVSAATISVAAADAGSPSSLASRPDAATSETGPSTTDALPPRRGSVMDDRAPFRTTRINGETPVLFANDSPGRTRASPVFEELPPPPEFAEPRGESPAPGAAVAELQVELARLREELGRLAASQVQAELDEVRRLQAQMAEVQTAQGLADVRSELAELRRQHETAVGEMRSALDAQGQSAAVPSAASPPPAVRITASKGDASRLSLRLCDASLGDALSAISRHCGRNIVPTVRASQTGLLNLSLEHVTADEALQALMRTSPLVAEQDANLTLVMTAEESRNRSPAEPTAVSRVIRPSYIRAADLAPLIEPLLTPGAGRLGITRPTTGIGPDHPDVGGDRLAQQDALVVVDRPDVVERVLDVVHEMDVPPPQVEVEVTILEVHLSERLKQCAHQSSDGSPCGSVLRCPDCASARGPNSCGCDAASLLCSEGSPGATRWNTYCGPSQTLVDHLQQWTEVRVLATPRLQVLNKQWGVLHVGNLVAWQSRAKCPLVCSKETGVAEAGTLLAVRPFVSPEGLIRLEIQPDHSHVQLATHGPPQVRGSGVATQVAVHDGCSVVIAGLFVEQSVTATQRVPVLGHLPLVGRALQHHPARTEHSEIVVCITPRVLVETRIEPLPGPRREILAPAPPPPTFYSPPPFAPAN